MCFSATASFAAGVVLSGAGVATIKKARKKSEIPFAAIPLLFGVQQIIEGGVWLSFQYGLPFLNQIATYGFIFFAYLFWPIFVPFAVSRIETDPKRKRNIAVFQGVGILVVLYLLFFMIGNPIVSHIVGDSIAYSMPKVYGPLLILAYLVATCGSCLASSHSMVRLLGVLTTISFFIAYYFYTFTYASVWCFFAAILSGVVYLHLRKSPSLKLHSK